MTPWSLAVAFPLTVVLSMLLMVGFDAAAAWFTRRAPSSYRRLWPVQFGLYVVIGFLAMLALLDIRRVEIVGALTGFVEATLGWAITWRIGPGRLADTNLVSIAIAVVTMTAFGFGLAIAGALLFNLVASMVLRGHG